MGKTSIDSLALLNTKDKASEAQVRSRKFREYDSGFFTGVWRIGVYLGTCAGVRCFETPYISTHNSNLSSFTFAMAGRFCMDTAAKISIRFR
jgi:hypothetical protein